MNPKNRRPAHPGKILLLEFLRPLDISQTKLARDLNIPVRSVNTLVNEKRGITAKKAILLARALKTTPEFWMSLQAAFDLSVARRKLAHA